MGSDSVWVEYNHQTEGGVKLPPRNAATYYQRYERVDKEAPPPALKIEYYYPSMDVLAVGFHAYAVHWLDGKSARLVWMKQSVEVHEPPNRPPDVYFKQCGLGASSRLNRRSMMTFSDDLSALDRLLDVLLNLDRQKVRQLVLIRDRETDTAYVCSFNSWRRYEAERKRNAESPALLLLKVKKPPRPKPAPSKRR